MLTKVKEGLSNISGANALSLNSKIITGVAIVKVSTLMDWIIAIFEVSEFVSALNIKTKLKWPGLEANNEDGLSIKKNLFNTTLQTKVIIRIAAIIIIRLTGHLAACDRASGVTFEPTLKPMQINENCLIGFGTKKVIPNKATKVDKITGPKR